MKKLKTKSRPLMRLKQFEDEGIDQDSGTNEIVSYEQGNSHDSHDSCHDCHDTNQPLNDQEIQSDSEKSDREEDLL